MKRDRFVEECYFVVMAFLLAGRYDWWAVPISLAIVALAHAAKGVRDGIQEARK